MELRGENRGSKYYQQQQQQQILSLFNFLQMEEYKFGGSKGSGAKSNRSLRLEVEAPTTTTTTSAATTTVTEDYLDYVLDHQDYPNYLDGDNRNTAEENRVTEEESSEDPHDHYYYGEEYPDTSEEDLSSEELLHTDDEHHDEDHEISEHSEAMTEHEYLDHDGANETYIESSRLHVDQAEARDSQLIENVRVFYFLFYFFKFTS